MRFRIGDMTAMDVLRAHAQERTRRAGIPSLSGKLDEARGTDRSHAEERWVELCLMVRGVSPIALDAIELFVMGSRGTEIRRTLLDPVHATQLPEWQAQDTTWIESLPVLEEVVAKPFRAQDVAKALNRARGLNLTAPEAKALRQEAIERVTDNQIRRGK